MERARRKWVEQHAGNPVLHQFSTISPELVKPQLKGGDLPDISHKRPSQDKTGSSGSLSLGRTELHHFLQRIKKNARKQKNSAREHAFIQNMSNSPKLRVIPLEGIKQKSQDQTETKRQQSDHHQPQTMTATKHNRRSILMKAPQTSNDFYNDQILLNNMKQIQIGEGRK